jgi:hypothetical protein
VRYHFDFLKELWLPETSPNFCPGGKQARVTVSVGTPEASGETIADDIADVAFSPFAVGTVITDGPPAITLIKLERTPRRTDNRRRVWSHLFVDFAVGV